MNILIVDDNKNNRMILKLLLEDYMDENPDVSFDIGEAEDGNVRSANDLYMNGTNVFNFAITKVPQLIKEIVEQSPCKKIENIDGFYLHQANEFMVGYIRRKLKLTKERVPVAVDGYGNTGPSSIPLLLTLLNSKQKNAVNKKNNILCGFGVGLSWGACYTNLENTKIFKMGISISN